MPEALIHCAGQGVKDHVATPNTLVVFSTARAKKQAGGSSSARAALLLDKEPATVMTRSGTVAGTGRNSGKSIRSDPAKNHLSGRGGAG